MDVCVCVCVCVSVCVCVFTLFMQLCVYHIPFWGGITLSVSSFCLLICHPVHVSEMNVCPDVIFCIAEPFATKLASVMHRHEPEFFFFFFATYVQFA